MVMVIFTKNYRIYLLKYNRVQQMDGTSRYVMKKQGNFTHKIQSRFASDKSCKNLKTFISWVEFKVAGFFTYTDFSKFGNGLEGQRKATV